jgi:hypothetical protein
MNEKTGKTGRSKHTAATVALLAALPIGAAAGAAAGPAATGSAAVVTARPMQQKARDEQQKARQVTAALTRLLRSKVSSPGGRLTLRVLPTARAGDGYFSEIYLAGSPGQLKKMRVTEFALRARDVHLDVPLLLREGSLRTLAARTTLRAVVDESDLTALLARGKRTAAMKLRVKFIGNQIRVSGNWNWGWFNGPVVGVGTLRLAPGHKVNFDIFSLKLNGSEVPAFVKARFSERLNPIISYDDLPFQPRFRALVFQGSKAILTA